MTRHFLSILALSLSAGLLAACSVMAPTNERDARGYPEPAVADTDEDGGSATATATATAAGARSAARTATAPAQEQPLRTVAVMKVKVNKRTKTVAFELFPEDCPMTVENFIRNAKDGLYSGLAFHRAIPNYLVQTGDPLTKSEKDKAEWGTGGPGFTVPAEIGRPHTRGAVAMARLGDAKNPNKESNGSQFYFALGNLSALNGKYTVFGEVISGIEVLDEISRVAVDTNDCPVGRVEVKSVRITETRSPAATAAAESADDETSRPGSKPDYEKGTMEKFIERIW